MSHVSLRLASLLAVAAAFLVLLPACMEMDQSVRIDKSGKGTATLTAIVDHAKFKELEQMMGAMMGGNPEGGGGPENPADEMDPEKVKQILEGNEKVRLVEATSEMNEETQKSTHRFKVEFDSPKDLYESGLISGSNVELAKLADGNFRFTSKMGGDQMPDDPAALEQMQMMMGMLEPYMAGMKFKVTMELPTAILETNGTKDGETKVVWSVGFKDLTDPSKTKQSVTFSGEGVAWTPFKVSAAELAERRAKRAAEVTGTEEDEPAESPATPAEPEPAK